MKRFYTAESVTEGHPDKLCDLIADSVLDDCLKEDSEPRVACEVLATKGRIIVAGEISSRRNPNVSEIVKGVLEDVGYSPEEIQIDVFLHKQSPDIAEAVSHSMEQRAGLSEEQDKRNEGAGDQGVMVGFACKETASLMPMPAVLANRIVRELSACRKSGYIAGILPDGKAQVTVESCSGILIKKSMDLVQLYFGESTPKSVMCIPTDNRGMVFTDDKGREFCFEQEGVNVWRSSFDSWLATKAKENGTEIRDETVAVLCEEKDDYVSVTLHGKDTYTENARYVLDCEGVVGTIKRKIIKDTPEYITTFQTFNKGSIDLDPHYFYAYLQPELSEYDAWFNVKDNLLIFGVAVKDRDKIQYYYDKFLAYMKNCHHLQIDEQTKAEKWLMSHIRPGYHIDYGVGYYLPERLQAS